MLKKSDKKDYGTQFKRLLKENHHIDTPDQIIDIFVSIAAGERLRYNSKDRYSVFWREWSGFSCWVSFLDEMDAIHFGEALEKSNWRLETIKHFFDKEEVLYFRDFKNPYDWHRVNRDSDLVEETILKNALEMSDAERRGCDWLLVMIETLPNDVINTIYVKYPLTEKTLVI